MSRIGKAPIESPAGVKVEIKDNVVTVKGPKGTLSQTVHPDLTVKEEDGHIVVTRPSDDRCDMCSASLTAFILFISIQFPPCRY